MKLQDISEVARESGIPASTLRFYEEKGLIESLGRRGLRRIYDRDIMERLALIRLAQSAGFTLDEIVAMFGDDRALVIDRATLAAKAEELGQRIRNLTALKRGLEHASNCPAPRHMDCPSFRRLVAISGKRRGRQRMVSPRPGPECLTHRCTRFAATTEPRTARRRPACNAALHNASGQVSCRRQPFWAPLADKLGRIRECG